jgi:hypothetical protein
MEPRGLPSVAAAPVNGNQYKQVALQRYQVMRMQLILHLQRLQLLYQQAQLQVTMFS